MSPHTDSIPQGAFGSLRAVTLGELLESDFPPREPLLGPWLTERHLAMVYAPTGCGKSWLSMAMALAVAGGGKVLDWQAPKARTVLYVDGEMDMEDLQSRARDLIPALGLDVSAVRENFVILARQGQDMKSKFPDLADEAGREYLITAVQKLRPAFVVLDNFSCLADMADENDASSFGAINDLLMTLKRDRVSTLLVHHSRKGAGGAGSYRGSSKLGVTLNSIIELRKPEGIASGVTAFDLIFEKLRCKQDATTENRRVTLVNIGGALNLMTAPLVDVELQRVAEAFLSGDYENQRDIADALRISPGELSKRKRAAIEAGLLTEGAPKFTHGGRRAGVSAVEASSDF